MKTKKFILLVLAMALTVSLCSCSPSKDSTEADTGSSPSSSDAESEPEPEPEEPEPDPKTTPEYHSTEAVQERGVLTIAVSGNAKMIYTVPDDPETYGELAGTHDGYIAELCRRVAQELGVQAEFVQYETVEKQLQAVADGEVDLAADNFVINEERLAIYEMTDTFEVTEIAGDEVFLSTNPQPWQRTEGETSGEPEPRTMIQSEEELAQARIATVKSTAQAINVPKKYPEAEVHLLDSNAAVLEALAAGQVDAAVFTTFDKAFADQIVQAILDGTVAQCGYEVPPYDYLGTGLILMKDNVDLCQSINGIFSSLRESGWMLECYQNEEAEASQRGII